MKTALAGAAALAGVLAMIGTLIGSAPEAIPAVLPAAAPLAEQPKAPDVASTTTKAAAPTVPVQKAAEPKAIAAPVTEVAKQRQEDGQ